MFEAGNRVTRKASFRVGTVELSSPTGCIVVWDYPRLSGINPYRCEFKTWLPHSYLGLATDYAEAQNAITKNKRQLIPSPSVCSHCSSSDFEYIDRHHSSHDGTPYVYVFRCKTCCRFFVQKEG